MAFTSSATAARSISRSMSEGFFIGLQTDYELMERKRAIGEKLKAIRPRAA